jgi:hypothetical protein
MQDPLLLAAAGPHQTGLNACRAEFKRAISLSTLAPTCDPLSFGTVAQHGPKLIMMTDAKAVTMANVRTAQVNHDDR